MTASAFSVWQYALWVEGNEENPELEKGGGF